MTYKNGDAVVYTGRETYGFIGLRGIVDYQRDIDNVFVIFEGVGRRGVYPNNITLIKPVKSKVIKVFPIVAFMKGK